MEHTKIAVIIYKLKNMLVKMGRNPLDYIFRTIYKKSANDTIFIINVVNLKKNKCIDIEIYLNLFGSCGTSLNFIINTDFDTYLFSKLNLLEAGKCDIVNYPTASNDANCEKKYTDYIKCIENLDGPIGPTGSIGDVGPVFGPQGMIGPTGSVGERGDTGLPGETGDQGVSYGIVGPTGPTGNIGFIGLQGSIGNNIIGNIGPTGNEGLIGPKGNTGLLGPVGNTGLPGNIGPQGITGNKGDSIIGDRGTTGNTGIIGSKGSVGATGINIYDIFYVSSNSQPIGNTCVQFPNNLLNCVTSVGTTGLNNDIICLQGFDKKCVYTLEFQGHLEGSGNIFASFLESNTTNIGDFISINKTKKCVNASICSGISSCHEIVTSSDPKYIKVNIQLESNLIQRGQTLFENNEFKPARVIDISGDGNEIIVGHFNNSVLGTSWGRVRVYEYISPNWVQKGQDLDGSNFILDFGFSVGISNDGSKIVVGAPDSILFNSGDGAVLSYEFISPNWVQRGSAIFGSLNNLGSRVDISDDGDTIAMSATDHVRIYDFITPSWIQRDINININVHSVSLSGDIALSGDSNLVAISTSTFTRTYEFATIWSQKGSDILVNVGSNTSVETTFDGNTIIIGNGTNDGGGLSSGDARIFEYTTDWVQKGLDIYGLAGDRFGITVAISDDGNTIAVGAILADVNAISDGYVKVYIYSGTNWIEVVTIAGVAFNDRYGENVALSSDGGIIGTVTSSHSTTPDYTKVFELVSSQLESSCLFIEKKICQNMDL